MQRFKLCLTLTIPTIVSACGDDGAAVTEGSSSGTSSTSSSSSESTGQSTTSSPDTSVGTAPDTPAAGESSSSGTTGSTGSEGTSTGSTTGDASSSSTGVGDVCGDGSITGSEVCEPDDLNDEDCVSQNFDAGELACAADCLSFDTTACVMFSCGNGILEGREICDGDQLAGADCLTFGHDAGTLACAAGCAAYDESGCVDFVCGNDILEGDEVCDTNQLSGEDCLSQGFDGGTLACADDCTAYDDTACTVCGDGQLDAGEACDSTNLAGQTCLTLGGAGGALGCDAMCSFDLFSCYPAVAETEPNDDTMVAVATDDFSAANANGPFTDDVTISAAISPAGDDDVFAVNNPLGVTQLLTVETFGGAGLGTCATADTFVTIRAADGAALASDDNTGIGNCSRIVNFSVAAGETVYLHAIDSGDNSAITRYFVQLALNPVGCGNLALDAGEQCDDGNLDIGDGCNATCGIEGGIAEVEPNGTTPQADAAPVSISSATPTTAIIGSVGALADVDTYRINVAADGVLRLETFSGLHDCTGGITTTLRLLNAAGATLINSNTDGIASCSAIVYPLAAGTYYAEVSETGNNTTISQYVLEAQFYADGGSETEPNETIDAANVQAEETFVFGDHSLNADSDVYALAVPQGGSVRLETIEGALGVETCESLGVDTRITLYNPNGTQLAEANDGGRGFCSRLDGTGSEPSVLAAHNLPAGTYYVQVRAAALAMGAAGQFTYRLAATVRAP